jgi:hypothetical protein
VVSFSLPYLRLFPGAIRRPQIVES